MPGGRNVPSPRGHRWEAFARGVIAYHGGVCHLCDLGHGGARQADHLVVVAEHPELAWKASNVRPAHGVPGNRCPVCGLACNQIRGSLSIERARRIIAERIAAAGAGNPPGAGNARRPARPQPDGDAGRPW